MITNLQMDLFQALLCSVYTSTPGCIRPSSLHGYFPSDAIKTVPAAAILLLPPWAEQPPHYTLGASAAHILWIYCVVVDPSHQHNLGSGQIIILYLFHHYTNISIPPVDFRKCHEPRYTHQHVLKLDQSLVASLQPQPQQQQQQHVLLRQ